MRRGARRLDPGPDPQPADAAAAADESVADLHLARFGRGPSSLPPRRRHVSGADRRAWPDRGCVRRTQASLYPRIAGGRAGHRSRSHLGAAAAARRAAEPAGSAGWLPLPSALPACPGDLRPGRGADTSPDRAGFGRLPFRSANQRTTGRGTMKTRLKYGVMLAGALAILAGDIAIAAAEGVLTIGRREDGTTMDP